MKIKFLGQAGLLVESKTCTIVCDPWFSETGGFLARWHQFPPNDHIDKKNLYNADYLYVSHEHHDHFDRKFLESFPKEVTVVLANFQTKDFRNSFRELGFEKIIELNDWEKKKLADDFEIMIVTDPGKYKEDSVIFIKTENHKILNKNDCYLSRDYLTQFSRFGIDVLFTQFSGAIWYPMIYEYENAIIKEKSEKVRKRLLENFIEVVNSINPSYVVPSAGPPCFLEDDCFEFNFEKNGIFPDQHDFILKIENKIHSKYNMMLPNDDLILNSDEEIKIENHNYFDFERKKELLREYQKKRLPYINDYLQKIPNPKNDLYEKFQEHFKKILNQSNYFSSTIDQIVEFQIEGKFGGTWQIDFKNQPVKFNDKKISEPEYKFTIDSKYLNLILNDELNWEELLLSLRLRIGRKPDIYNGSLFALLQYGRDPLLIQRAENIELRSKCPITINVQHNHKMYKIQRSCPHLGEDLKNATIKNGILVCPRHQWSFDLSSNGKCVSGGNRDLPIYSITDLDESENTGCV